MSILDLAEKIKDWLVVLFWPLFWGHLALFLAFLGLISYEIGSKPGVVIAIPSDNYQISNSRLESAPELQAGDKSSREDLAKTNLAPVSGEVKGSIVASKNGAKYYTPGCSGAKRIKPENIISFISTKEAESAGYTKAKNCK